MLFSFQGKVSFGPRLPSGKPGALTWAGNVPECTIALAVESAQKNESFSGSRLPYGRLKTSQSGTLNMTFDEWNVKNLALGLYSEELAVATGSVTGEVFPDDLAVGDQVLLDHPYASALVITDSTGSPVTVDTDDYALVGHNASMVEVKGLASYTQPWKAAYTYAGYSSLDAFTKPSQEVYVVFDGINTETGDPVLVRLYRVRTDPFSNLGLIHQEYGSLPLTGAVLYDELNDDGSTTGGFLKIVGPGA